ncbi:959_t:CDS:2 [Racocetra fulgida]|uniref:959_t:CDS:1 n=1 Tax=Racocetra fulgida TaxID=60492 RepID=A0A9N9HNH2_9GLOM|nr:959_t:CDS:2 [Racocetra fulgida]
MSFTSPLDDSLQSLLNQLNTEFDECLKQIVPNGLDNTVKSSSSQDESQGNFQLNIIRLLRFLQIAKKLETALSKIIQSEKQQEKIALQDEIIGLHQNIAQQREVIEKYTALVREWSKEFSELEEENKLPL